MPNGLEAYTPELISMMAEYYGITQDEALQALLYKAAEADKGTQMPDMRRYGENHVVAPNPMEVAAAAIKQYRGGEDSAKAIQQIQANIMRKKQINEAGLGADMAQRRAAAEPAPLQPSNGAMMSPDPSTMTDENAFQAQWVNPWEMEQRAARRPVNADPQSGPKHDLGPSTPPGTGPNFAIPGQNQSPLFGWNDIQNIFKLRRK